MKMLRFFFNTWKGLCLAALLVVGVGYGLVVMMCPVRVHPGEVDSFNKLHNISMWLAALAENAHGFLPAYCVDEEGKPLQSWTLFLNPEGVEKAYNKSVAWNDASNVPYQKGHDWTWYHVWKHPGTPEMTCFTMVVPANYQPHVWQAADAAETLYPVDTNPDFVPVIIEDAGSVHHWLEPKVLCLEEMFAGKDLDEPSGLGGVHPGKIVMMAADGKVYLIPDTTSRRILLMLSTPEGMKKLRPIQKKELTEFEIVP